MVKCPFCHFDNEDGALFCERCSSDLSGVAPATPAPVPTPVPVPMPIPEPMPMALAEPMPVAEPMAEALPMVFAEAVPVAIPEPVPVEPVIAAIPAIEVAPVAPPPPIPAPVLAVPVAAVPPPPAPAPTVGGALPIGAQPRLQVLRGQKRNIEYPIYEGDNFIGRADEKPVDIDLEEQEPPDRIWCSRQHAVISLQSGVLTLEDLNSANGTYINRARIYPGQAKTLAVNDIVQIGNVQMKVII